MIKSNPINYLLSFCLLGFIFTMVGCGGDDAMMELDPVNKRASDSLALVALYNSTDGANWEEVWDLSSPMDEWFGITLHATGAVRYIELQGNGHVGTLPSELTELSELEALEVRSGELSGGIPEGLGALTRLKFLRLDDNGLSGDLPEDLSMLSFLSVMQLSDNNLTGRIPSSYGDLSNLDYLGLDNNNLTGSIPSGLGNIQGMNILDLDGNDLSGCIPDALMNHCSLISFNVHGNPQLPWQGDTEMFCGGFPQIGAPCELNGEEATISADCDCI